MELQYNKNRRSKTFRLALFTTIAIFIVNTFGFVDTITGSTVGCGRSWPLCNGSIDPRNWDIHAWIEFGHRTVVFLASISLLLLSVIAWRKYGSKKRVRVMILLALLGIVLESTLGAMSVMFVNPPAVLATHMGFALLSFGSLFVLTSTIGQLDRPSTIPAKKATKGMVRFSWFSLVYLYLAIYFGSYVSFSGAGHAFQGFPFPTERYADVHSFLWIDITHRLIACGLLVIMAIMVVVTRRNKAERADMYFASVWSLIFVCLQGAIGALMIYTNLSLGSILLHVSVVSLLFGLMCFLAVQSILRPFEASEPHSLDDPTDESARNTQHSNPATV